MDKLWAPWRKKYICEKKTTKCLFCKIHKQKSDKKNYIILRSTLCFAVLNKFPYNNGHLLIAPYQHTAELEKLESKEIIDMYKVTLTIKKILKKVLKPDAFNFGFNLGETAGAGVTGHLHLHLVPRWKADTNYMPVLFETKVISQSLGQLYTELKKEIKKG